MGLTHFPNGVNAGNNAGGSATLAINSIPIPPIAIGTANLVAGVGTVTTGLGGLVTAFVASVTNQPAGGGTTFGYVAGSAVAGGAVVCTVYDQSGVAGTATTPISWFAGGTA